MKKELPEKIKELCEHLQDKKAEQIKVYDVSEQGNITDYFIFCNGSSDTHVKALAGHTEDKFRELGERASFKEGLTDGRWVILDYIDCVVHFFIPSLREYYHIDSIWHDCLVREYEDLQDRLPQG